MNIEKTLNGLIEDVYNGDIESLGDLQRELIYLRDEVKQLDLCGVSQQREQLINFFNIVKPMAYELAQKPTEDVVDFYLSKIN